MGSTKPIDAEATPNGIWLEFEDGPKFVTRGRLSDRTVNELPE